MAQSPEHEFLSVEFLSTVSRMSRSRLYSYLETGRKKFDFSCILSENWNYDLDGQTLWKHVEGVDKDIRTLLVGSNAQIAVYVARDTTRNRSVFYEAARDFRSSGLADSLSRLKVFWIPSDFDADNEKARGIVARHLQAEVMDDLLFNVVFGRLTKVGVRAIVTGSGFVGLETAILHHIATEGFVNYPGLRARFGASSGTLRDRVQRLLASGFLLMPRDGGQMYHVSAAGRAFLRLCRQTERLIVAREPIVEETRLVLSLLEIEPDETVGDVGEAIVYDESWLGQKTNEAMFRILARLIVMARLQWGIDWDRTDLNAHPDELDSSRWMKFG